ncbi:hypothetical protein ASPBRDRAFT_289103 [Aspergillus brasiliensis CBS 101740]|uniref:Uncharacterized protein n=1 Tax=Aspergillus brasiliensis (strain CBS 101740 / IMI 381727 / IBT 21946) TaxID=767769 RepID=A0A1L9UB86_ASPBC|nr:hypothetical protein ASPBRDRAFT_289103 [Aspergillus brasiliensis CBS 101740]
MAHDRQSNEVSSLTGHVRALTLRAIGVILSRFLPRQCQQKETRRCQQLVAKSAGGSPSLVVAIDTSSWGNRKMGLAGMLRRSNTNSALRQMKARLSAPSDSEFTNSIPISLPSYFVREQSEDSRPAKLYSTQSTHTAGTCSNIKPRKQGKHG